MELYDLTTLHSIEPLGVEGTPYFGWKMAEKTKNTCQLAYRLQVANAEQRILWDTGRIDSAQAAFVPYEGPALPSRSKISWTVIVWDNHGQQATRQTTFETALKPDDWQAKWMRTPRPAPQRAKGFGTQPPATLFRRAFALHTLPVQARLYVTCLGVYRLTINGRRPDDRKFAPEHTSYRGLLCYQTYDVGALLQPGENVLGMEVGDGFYCCPQTQPPIDDLQPDHTVLFQLELRDAEGHITTICSDEKLLCAEGAVRSSDLFDGERYDARLEQTGWDKSGFRAQGWQKAISPAQTPAIETLHAQLGEPVRPVKLLPAVKLYTSPNGEQIVDFGQVVAGCTRVCIDLPRGQTVTLEHFEATNPDGSYYNNVQSPMGCTEQKDEYISNGVPAVYEARFTFHGFRYLRVRGLKNPKPEDFTAVVLSSEKANAGEFSCSDQRLNRLYANTRWSQCANTISIPTDCPQREKAGWTGDISLYAKTMLLNEGATAFLTRWLHSLRIDQRDNGSVPFTVPDTSIYHYSGLEMGPASGCGGPVCSSGWGDAAVMVPWAMYEVTGNREILKTQYESMKGWCNYVIGRARVRAPGSKWPKEIEENLWDTGFQFGEWLIPSTENDPFEKIEETMAKSSSYTAPIFAWLVCDKMAQTAVALDSPQDADFYAQHADAMKHAIQTALIDENGRMRVERQGAYVLMLAFDLVPEQYAVLFAERLEALIHANHDCLDTGFLATPYLLDALCKAGKRNLAEMLLYQEKSPSWLACVKAGATTIWESWEMYLPDGTPKNESFNHYTFGCVDDWMFRNLAGLDQNGVGFQHLVFKPQPDASLQWAARSFMTEQGLAAIRWQKEKSRFTMKVTVPCNADALVELPDGACHTIGSGDYIFSCNL